MPPGARVRCLLLAGLLAAACGADPGRVGEPAAAGAAGSASAPSPAGEATDGIWDRTARFLAGLPTDPAGPPVPPAWAAIEAGAEASAHRAEMDAAWRSFEDRQLGPMRSWSQAELAPRLSGAHEVLYPFSGPDLIHPLVLLPGRRRYWLLSLEPVGTVPDPTALDPEARASLLAAVHRSLASALEWSFFQTRALRADLAVPELDGVLPLLLFFAARAGETVAAVHYLFVSPEGTLREVAARPGGPPMDAAAGEVAGVRLVLGRPGETSPREAVYFGVDLSSHSIEVARPGFFAFVAGHGPFTTYLKAASYLMFKPKYLAIRRLLLAESDAILQDDSGIPFAAFEAGEEAGRWETRLYGRYREPIALFAAYAQEDLAAAYAALGDVPPLPFTAGYRTRRGQSNLLLATRRGGGAE